MLSAHEEAGSALAAIDNNETQRHTLPEYTWISFFEEWLQVWPDEFREAALSGLTA
jgi:hypothetical protein